MAAVKKVAVKKESTVKTAPKQGVTAKAKGPEKAPKKSVTKAAAPTQIEAEEAPTTTKAPTPSSTTQVPPSNKAPRPNKPRAAVRKESFYALVSDPIDPTKTVFVNVTDHLGRPWPFAKPKATCGVRVSDNIVSYSMLVLTNRVVSKITEGTVQMPRGPLAKLERHAARYAGADTSTLTAVIDDTICTFTIERDENKVASLTLNTMSKRPTITATTETGLEALFEEETSPKEAVITEDGTLELPKASVQVAIYLTSPRISNYTLALGFIHHFGKAGDTETVTRLVAKSLALATQLGDFRLLAGLESVEVPPAPNRANYSKARTRSKGLEVSALIPVQLFTEPEPGATPTPIAIGNVALEIDLAHINQASGKLLFHLTPDANLTPHFELYRSIFTEAVIGLIRERIGTAELEQVVDQVVLGMVTTTSAEALRTALRTPGQFNLTPSLLQRIN